MDLLVSAVCVILNKLWHSVHVGIDHAYSEAVSPQRADKPFILFALYARRSVRDLGMNT